MPLYQVSSHPCVYVYEYREMLVVKSWFYLVQRGYLEVAQTFISFLLESQWYGGNKRNLFGILDYNSKLWNAHQSQDRDLEIELAL